jgi:hypothetical protein
MTARPRRSGRSLSEGFQGEADPVSDGRVKPLVEGVLDAPLVPDDFVEK